MIPDRLYVAPRTDGWELPEHVPLPTPEGYTHPWLLSRRITLETQGLFSLLWCEQGWFRYLDHEERERKMPFSGRVLIPVADLDGTIKTFMGRDATGSQEPRYLFAPMLPGTGRFLYGGHMVLGKEHVVVAEGPFDVMAVHQAISSHPDFRHLGVVGTFGIAVSYTSDDGDDQLVRFHQLRRHVPESELPY